MTPITDLRLRRREVEDVNGGIRIEHDDGIEVGGHVGKAFGDFVDHLDEPAGATLLPCGMTSHSKRRVGVQNAVRGIVSL